MGLWMRLLENKLFVGSSILFGGFGVAYLIARSVDTTASKLGVMGIVIFIFALIGLNYLSKEHELTTGEVRRSIAIASTVVFFGLFFLGSISLELKPLIDNFWKVYGIIIAFYFGARAAEEITKQQKNKSDQQPLFKFKKTHDISGSELRRVISEAFPNARIYIADASYKHVSYDELVRWLKEDSLDQMRWLKDIWDCDNFAVESYCRAHKVVGNLAYGECWGKTPTGYHAFCLAYCDGKIKIIEPQNDDTKEWKKSDYGPDFIKI